MTSQDALIWIAEIFEEPEGRLTEKTTREDIPGWDSLGTLTLIAGLDEQFDIHLSERDIESMRRVGDVLNILRDNGKLVDS